MVSGALLALSPALALALLVLARRYPGERRLVALAVRRRAPAHPRRAPRRAPVPRAAWGPPVPRIAMLVARALAGRQPPAPLAT